MCNFCHYTHDEDKKAEAVHFSNKKLERRRSLGQALPQSPASCPQSPPSCTSHSPPSSGPEDIGNAHKFVERKITRRKSVHFEMPPPQMEQALTEDDSQVTTVRVLMNAPPEQYQQPVFIDRKITRRRSVAHVSFEPSPRWADIMDEENEVTCGDAQKEPSNDFLQKPPGTLIPSGMSLVSAIGIEEQPLTRTRARRGSAPAAVFAELLKTASPAEDPSISATFRPICELADLEPEDLVEVLTRNQPDRYDD
jgi:hypothetical protein